MRVHIGTAQDVDQLAVRAEAAGISLDADPRDTPWNSRTFEVTDPSGFKEAGTNKATAVTWVVGDKVHDVVQALKVKGVTFEHYDMPGLTLERDVHVGYGMHVAWFKDPDGNILNIVSR